jgi:chromosome segregation ATPase
VNTNAELLRAKEAQHAELVIECRNASDKLTETDQACKDAQDKYQHLNRAWMQSDFAIAEHRREKPEFPLPAETAAREKELKKLEEARTKAFNANNEAYATVQKLQGERRRLTQVMNDLRFRESEMRKDLAALRSQTRGAGMPFPYGA